MGSPRIKQNEGRVSVYSTRTQHDIRIFACLLRGDVMHAPWQSGLGGLGVVAVPCGAVGDEVPDLPALEASALGLAVVHAGTLVIHGLTVDILSLGCSPSRGMHSWTWGWLPRTGS